MGYDCTLHVIDEARIRNAFVPILLGSQPPEELPGRSPDETAQFWREVRRALNEDTPESAAKGMCQAAVVYSAALLPYHYERGVAFSLWPDIPECGGTRFPQKLRASPESMFEALVAAHPRLRGQFPLEFEGNGETGVYVPSDKVGDVLAWVLRQVKKIPKYEQQYFRGLIEILKRCVEGGYGYWEGTDLPLEAKRIEVEQPARPRWQHSPFPFDGRAEYRGGRGTLAFFPNTIGHPQKCQTTVADFSTWPPKFTVVNEYARSAVVSRGGRWLLVSMMDDTYEYRVRLREPGSPPNECRTLHLEGPKAAQRIESAGFLGEQVVAFRDDEAGRQGIRRVPLLQECNALVEAEGFEPIDESKQDIRDRIGCSFGVVPLGDGSDVLCWKGRGYERRDGKFVSTFRFSDLYAFWGNGTVPVGDDGFFYTGYGKQSPLLEIHRNDADPRRHLPILDHVMSVGAGPPGSLLCRAGHNKKGYLAVLYWPGEDAFIPIEEELFPEEDPDEFTSYLWMDNLGLMLAGTGRRLWAVPAEAVLNLPRKHAGTGRRIRE